MLDHVTYNTATDVITSVAEPKLYVSAATPAPTFKKFRLRLRSRFRLQLGEAPICKAFQLKCSFSDFFF